MKGNCRSAIGFVSLKIYGSHPRSRKNANDSVLANIYNITKYYIRATCMTMAAEGVESMFKHEFKERIRITDYLLQELNGKYADCLAPFSLDLYFQISKPPSVPAFRLF